MKHLHSNRILGRTASNREQLLRNLSKSLLAHGAITTTEAKAKELRRFFEPLVRRAQGERTLHMRRLLLKALGTSSNVDQLLELAERHRMRTSGYVRMTRIHAQRQDAARMMRVEFTE